MTSTTIFQGGISDKPSCRVRAPPGGKSSDIFGVAEKQQPPATNSVVEVSPTDQPVVVSASSPPGQPSEAAKNASGEPVAVVQLASTKRASNGTAASGKPAPRNAGYNPITGEAYGGEQQPVRQVSKPGRQPPGGASSGLW
jgi:hypothetical protein